MEVFSSNDISCGQGSEMSIHENVRKYYEQANEADRLKVGDGQLEFLRTQEIVKRYLLTESMRILDVGGGTGPIRILAEQHWSRGSFD